LLFLPLASPPASAVAAWLLRVPNGAVPWFRKQLRRLGGARRHAVGLNFIGRSEELSLRASSGGCFLKEFDGVSDRQDCFGGIVGNLDSEFLFEGHDELDRVERICAKVFHEIGALDDFVGLDAEMIHNNLFHPLGDIAHGGLFLILEYMLSL
jgi:hypothetical protein